MMMVIVFEHYKPTKKEKRICAAVLFRWGGCVFTVSFVTWLYPAVVGGEVREEENRRSSQRARPGFFSLSLSDTCLADCTHGESNMAAISPLLHLRATIRSTTSSGRPALPTTTKKKFVFLNTSLPRCSIAATIFGALSVPVSSGQPSLFLPACCLRFFPTHTTYNPSCISIPL